MINTGTKLGSYEILSAIGAGGMGEVYRARDSKLGRDVAIKVLPAEFSRDTERMSRFQREAKVLASLNHPNIAAIYGFEDSQGAPALVMELVEGPTLADRIKQVPIPIDEALKISKQICEALEYAHERGIVHRDLKPANIKVTNDDSVKVLDFGLAKAIEGDPSSIDISSSPTMSRMATMQGVLLGTAAYMSPEQAKAKPVDRRADIWAFGCVLYEMLTAKMAFSGETVTDTLAAVIMKEPDWSLLPAATPSRVQLLAFNELTPGTGSDIWVLRLSDRQAEPFLQTSAQESAARFSPDGHWLAYVSDASGRNEVYVQPYPGPGGRWQVSTDGGGQPVWNRNGREIFYLNGEKMMAVDVSTGPNFSAGKPRMLFAEPYGLSSSWLSPFYAVSPDGQRFLTLKPTGEAGTVPNQINLVLNWTEELKRLVPIGTK